MCLYMYLLFCVVLCCVVVVLCVLSLTCSESANSLITITITINNKEKLCFSREEGKRGN